MSWASGEMLGFDLETTGPDPLVDLPVAFACVWFADGKEYGARTALVNPGIAIPPGATSIHGITTAMVQERGGDLERTMEGLAAILLKGASDGTPVVGMNVKFDLTLIDTWLRLNTANGLRDRGWDAMVLDALVLDRMVDQYRKGKRTLTALCDHYEVKPQGDLHDAKTDVIAAYEVVQAIAEAHHDVRDAAISDVFLSEQLGHKEWAESFNAYRAKKGQPPMEESAIDWPLPGDVPEVPNVDLSQVKISDGQVTRLVLRLKEVFGVDGHEGRVWLLAQLIDRDVESTKDVRLGEYEQAIEYLESVEGKSMASILSEQARIYEEATHTAQEVFSPAGVGLEAFGELDLGGASKGVVTTTMQKVMHMQAKELTPLLKQFKVVQKGNLNDKRLRFYEYCCRERAAGNEEVEALFT